MSFERLKLILSFENDFGGDFTAHLTKSAIMDFVKWLNGVVTGKSLNKALNRALNGLQNLIYWIKIRPHGFCHLRFD